MSIQADRAHPDGARAWWQRILLVPQAPRAVFAELRDDSREAAEDRQDAIAAVAFFAGLALTLLSSPAASFVGLVNYWLAGGALYLALSRLGATSSYRQARHLLALAAVPLALSLVLLPVRLALYGSDIFRSGGADSGSGAHVFTVLEAGFGLWAVALLAIGIRVVEGWGWPKTVGAIAVFGVLVAVADLVLNLFGG
jgi:hypothetical protein